MSAWRCTEAGCDAHGEQASRRAARAEFEHHILTCHNEVAF